MTEATLVDTNVLVDIFSCDPTWFAWSKNSLADASQRGRLVINTAVYAELAVQFPDQSTLDDALGTLKITIADSPKTGLYLAAKAFSLYKKRGGSRQGVLPDFFIGGHAAAENWPLISRDKGRYSTYFPSVRLITPEPH